MLALILPEDSENTEHSFITHNLSTVMGSEPVATYR